jgi:putative polyhydroxyalkanoate system protein
MPQGVLEGDRRSPSKPILRFSTASNDSVEAAERLIEQTNAMPDIRIARAHSLPLSRAKAAAQAAADDLAQRYAVTSQWQGDTLHFQRSGVTGRIEVSPSQIALEISLGLLLKGFKSRIEQSVGQQLDTLLAKP